MIIDCTTTFFPPVSYPRHLRLGFMVFSKQQSPSANISFGLLLQLGHYLATDNDRVIALNPSIKRGHHDIWQSVFGFCSVATVAKKKKRDTIARNDPQTPSVNTINLSVFGVCSFVVKIFDLFSIGKCIYWSLTSWAIDQVP